MLDVVLVVDFPEVVHAVGVDNQQDTTAGTESEDLRKEPLVEGAKALFTQHNAQGRPCPVVLSDLALDLACALDSGLDDVEGRVQSGTDGTTDHTADQVVEGLLLGVLSLRQQVTDLEDDTKVSCVPDDVSPQGGLETVVEGENALVTHGLEQHVHGTLVDAGLGLVLESDLDQFERHDDERLGGTCTGTVEDRQALVELVHAERLLPERAPGVVSSELGGPLGSLHQDGSGDPSVERGRALVLDDLCEAVDDTGVLASSAGPDLKLDPCLDHVQRIHGQDFRDACDGACEELEVEWQRTTIYLGHCGDD